MRTEEEQEIETLAWRLQHPLMKNFALSLDLPKPESYDKGTTVFASPDENSMKITA